MFEHRRNDDNKIYNGDIKIEYKEYVEPVFNIDSDGRVICEKHSQINRINALSHTIKQNPKYIRQYEAILTCKTCMHYFNDDCFFPRFEIDKIEADRVTNQIQCKLCGAKIDRSLTIINKLYLESKKDKIKIEIPVMCCSCYASLSDNTFIQNSKKRLFFFITSLGISAYFLFYYFWTLIRLSSFFILFFIPFIFWGYISFRDMRNVYFLIKGRKYYEKVFGLSLNEEKQPEERYNREY